jgi:ATP phosphoribosyltransferase
MIRLALPKGRNLGPTLAAFRAAGYPLAGLEVGDRRLRLSFADEGFEVLLLKDWDLPLYVEYGIADFGVIGSDVLAEVGSRLLLPARLRDGRCRQSLIGRPNSLPAPGQQVRLATKYPQTARRALEEKPWGAEIVALSGSVELAPLLELAELALDIVQTGQTLRDNDLVELEVLYEVAPCLVMNRAAFQQNRPALNDLIDRFEAAGVAL